MKWMFALLFVTIGVIAVTAILIFPTLFLQHAQREGVSKSLADALVLLSICICPLSIFVGIKFFLLVTRSMDFEGNTAQPPASA